ncbi:hypothetical protein B0H13DRAFT_1905261 [Mycena leptocephala]|nr:hypothetical protein B0H13DRAFT_1905261 [Mycena leptocephala]
MFSRLTTALALALALVSFSTPATAASPCGVCSPFMFFSGVNRTLTLQREEEMNTVQCDYSGGNLPSPIVIPYCLYANINGAVLVTNTGPTLTSVPGAWFIVFRGVALYETRLGRHKFAGTPPKNEINTSTESVLQIPAPIRDIEGSGRRLRDIFTAYQDAPKSREILCSPKTVEDPIHDTEGGGGSAMKREMRTKTKNRMKGRETMGRHAKLSPTNIFTPGIVKITAPGFRAWGSWNTAGARCECNYITCVYCSLEGVLREVGYESGNTTAVQSGSERAREVTEELHERHEGCADRRVMKGGAYSHGALDQYRRTRAS